MKDKLRKVVIYSFVVVVVILYAVFFYRVMNKIRYEIDKEKETYKVYTEYYV